MYQLQVHFRGYPSEILSPCEGEDSVKWSYMNSLKEVCFENQNYYHVLSQRNLQHSLSLSLSIQATFIITGNSKSVMNMSHADQVALWESVMKGTLQKHHLTSTNLSLAGQMFRNAFTPHSNHYCVICYQVTQMGIKISPPGLSLDHLKMMCQYGQPPWSGNVNKILMNLNLLDLANHVCSFALGLLYCHPC